MTRLRLDASGAEKLCALARLDLLERGDAYDTHYQSNACQSASGCDDAVQRMSNGHASTGLGQGARDSKPNGRSRLQARRQHCGAEIGQRHCRHGDGSHRAQESNYWPWRQYSLGYVGVCERARRGHCVSLQMSTATSVPSLDTPQDTGASFSWSQCAEPTETRGRWRRARSLLGAR